MFALWFKANPEMRLSFSKDFLTIPKDSWSTGGSTVLVHVHLG